MISLYEFSELGRRFGFFRGLRMVIAIYGDLCVLPSHRVDSLRKINEVKRSSWM